jgi:hypothetical protein
MSFEQKGAIASTKLKTHNSTATTKRTNITTAQV